MLSKKLKSVALLATVFGLVPSVYAQGTIQLSSSSSAEKPVTWVCSKLTEVVHPESPAYGEKFSTVYVADVYADGTCNVRGSVTGAPTWTGWTGLSM